MNSNQTLTAIKDYR